jgi:hypothetical protein
MGQGGEEEHFVRGALRLRIIPLHRDLRSVSLEGKASRGQAAEDREKNSDFGRWNGKKTNDY